MIENFLEKQRERADIVKMKFDFRYKDDYAIDTSNYQNQIDTKDMLAGPLNLILKGDHSINMKLKLKSLGNIETKTLDNIKARMNAIAVNPSWKTAYSSPRVTKPIDLPAPREKPQKTKK